MKCFASKICLLPLISLTILTGCGDQSGTTEQVENDANVSHDRFDVKFFSITPDIEALDTEEVHKHLFNEEGFLYATPSKVSSTFVSKVDCHPVKYRFERLPTGEAHYETSLVGDDCLNLTQNNTKKQVFIDLFIQCLKGDNLMEPTSLVSGSAIDSTFQPCGPSNSYRMRVSRSTKMIQRHEDSETTTIQVTSLMTPKGDFCDISFDAQNQMVLGECSEYTKISVRANKAGESPSVEVRAIKHLHSLGLVSKVGQHNFAKGKIAVTINNWEGEVQFRAKKNTFEISDGEDELKGQLKTPEESASLYLKL